jgi:hypothetical protein
MRRPLLLLLLGLMTSGGSLLIVPWMPPSCKPTAPIDLEAKIIGDPSVPFGVIALASSRTGAEVELEIFLPDGILLLAGSPKQKGRRCEARLDLRAKDRTRLVIRVQATFVEGSARMSRVLSLVVFDGPVPVRGRPAKDARGNAILELSP